MWFLRGILAPFRGAQFILRHGLGHLVVVPAVVNLLLATGACAASYLAIAHDGRLRALLGGHGTAASILTALAALAVGGIFFLAGQPLVGGLFDDRLSERVEAIERGTVPTVPTLHAARLALGHAVIKVALYAGVALLGLLLLPFFGLGSAVFLVLGATSLAYDSFDYALARRGVAFAAKLHYLSARPGLVAGFAVGAAALYLIPLAFLFAPACLSAGATLAFLDGEATS